MTYNTNTITDGFFLPTQPNSQCPQQILKTYFEFVLRVTSFQLSSPLPSWECCCFDLGECTESEKKKQQLVNCALVKKKRKKESNQKVIEEVKLTFA